MDRITTVQPIWTEILQLFSFHPLAWTEILVMFSFAPLGMTEILVMFSFHPLAVLDDNTEGKMAWSLRVASVSDNNEETLLLF